MTPWLLTASLAAQTVPEDYPSRVIVLADWGMSDVSEIGYLHVGVLHEREGDRLAVYDVRPQAPVVQWPSEPQHRTPPLDGDVFLAVTSTASPVHPPRRRYPLPVHLPMPLTVHRMTARP